MIEIRLEKLSGHAKVGKVGKIHVSVGDEVKVGNPLFEIESNKGNITIESKGNGKIISIEVTIGMVVKIGDVLAKMTGKEEGVTKSSSFQSTFHYMSGMLKPKKQEIECDIAIIGGGPGGYISAIQAAKLGAKVVLIEKDRVGGTCLNWGCIPTKTLIRSAEVYKNLKEAKKYGLIADDISIDMKTVVQRKREIIQELAEGIEYLLEKHHITLLKGLGRILDRETVYVQNDRVETTIKTKNIIIATGSQTASIPIPGVELKNVITSREGLELTKLPNKLVIIGGGIIGMEFAFMFANFGIDISVVEYFDKILNGLDDDVCEEITQIAEARGIKLYTGAKVEEILEDQDKNCIVTFQQDGEKKYITAEYVLMAVGRKPFFDGIGMEELGIELNDNKKGIKVNEKMQTNIPNIYAIGDVTNKMQLAHIASHQGIVAVKNIMGQECTMDYDVVPSAIFTDPEIAMVGIGEKAAMEKGMDVAIGKFPFSANGKALILGENRGFVKIIKDPSTGKILGGTIIGPHATDLIAEIALAVKNGLTVQQVIETIYAHPTTAEAVHEGVLAAAGGALHFVL